MKPMVTVTGWTKTETLLDLVGALKNGANVSIGVIAGQAGADAQTATVAAVHEFGAPDANIPERSFLRSTMREKRPQWLEFAASRVKAHVMGKLGGRAALEQLGLKMAADVKATIVAGIDPENEPATIAAKGSSTPLIDTGQLENSITHRVELGPVKP